LDRTVGFSQAVLVFNRGFGGTRVYDEKRVIEKKNKLIDIGLRVAFSGYWKLFMDGNSLDIGFLRLLIPVNQLVPNV
jgi:hypothetical protein